MMTWTRSRTNIPELYKKKVYGLRAASL